MANEAIRKEQEKTSEELQAYFDEIGPEKAREEIYACIDELVKDGYLRPTGELRLNRAGGLEPVYKAVLPA